MEARLMMLPRVISLKNNIATFEVRKFNYRVCELINIGVLYLVKPRECKDNILYLCFSMP